MTNELEKTFFDTFGIEPIEFKSCDVGTFCPYPEKECGTDTCPYYRTYKVDYPQITDRILLELEAIIHNEYNILVYEKFMDSIKITAYPRDDNLPCDPAYFTVMAQADNKREALLVLAMDINVQHYIKHQVRTLFEEG